MWAIGAHLLHIYKYKKILTLNKICTLFTSIYIYNGNASKKLFHFLFQLSQLFFELAFKRDVDEAFRDLYGPLLQLFGRTLSKQFRPTSQQGPPYIYLICVLAS